MRVWIARPPSGVTPSCAAPSPVRVSALRASVVRAPPAPCPGPTAPRCPARHPSPALRPALRFTLLYHHPVVLFRALKRADFLHFRTPFVGLSSHDQIHLHWA